MKHYIRHSWLILILIASACYKPLEIETENIDQVDIPIKIASPLVDGQLQINFDSLVNFDKLDNGFITFENNRAYIMFDTVFDFYDHLSGFLGAADIDFGNATQFRQSYDMDIESKPTVIQVIGEVDGNIVHDDNVPISPQDSFKAQYNHNAVFLGIGQDAELTIDGYDLDEEMDFGLDFEIYMVEIRSGQIEVALSADNLPMITDDSLHITPAFHYTDNGNDTIISQEEAINIVTIDHKFPLGLEIKLKLKLGNVFTAAGDTFIKEYSISSFDTTLSVDLTDFYYASDGSNNIDVEIKNWMEIDAEAQKAIVPLPDRMNIDADINNLEFKQVQFNYGSKSILNNDLDIDFNLLDKLPDEIEDRFSDDIETDGFYIKEPMIKLKLRSNLGFSVQLALDNIQIKTSGSPELITNDGTASLSLKQPENPKSFTTPVVALEDSMVIDSTTSRISEIDLFDMEGIYLDYAILINPEDNAHEEGKHNFIYLYDEEDQKDMYDVKLSARAQIPIAFRFNNISLESTQALNMDSLTSDLDLLSFEEQDSISLNVKLWTNNFPFDLRTQFYFGQTNSSGNLEIMDSLFDSEALIIPSSSESMQDSTSWNITLNSSRYDALQAMDSVKLKVRFSMNDENYYHVEKGSSLTVGYKFSIAPSSATINVE